MLYYKATAGCGVGVFVGSRCANPSAPPPFLSFLPPRRPVATPSCVALCLWAFVAPFFREPPSKFGLLARTKRRLPASQGQPLCALAGNLRFAFLARLCDLGAKLQNVLPPRPL